MSELEGTWGVTEANSWFHTGPHKTSDKMTGSVVPMFLDLQQPGDRLP